MFKRMRKAITAGVSSAGAVYGSVSFLGSLTGGAAPVLVSLVAGLGVGLLTYITPKNAEPAA